MDYNDLVEQGRLLLNYPLPSDVPIPAYPFRSDAAAAYMYACEAWAINPTDQTLFDLRIAYTALKQFPDPQLPDLCGPDPASAPSRIR